MRTYPGPSGTAAVPTAQEAELRLVVDARTGALLTNLQACGEDAAPRS